MFGFILPLGGSNTGETICMKSALQTVILWFSRKCHYLKFEVTNSHMKKQLRDCCNTELNRTVSHNFILNFFGSAALFCPEDETVFSFKAFVSTYDSARCEIL